MRKGQSGREDHKGPFSRENALPAKKQPFASRGQSAKEDFHGKFSKELPIAPAVKTASRVFAPGQAWAGPYTTNKVDTGKSYDIPHDVAGNPKR